MESAIKWIVSILGTFGVYLFGGFDIALQSLLIAIILDYITGMSKGYVNKKLNSNAGLKGIVKKLCILCLVALAVLVDHVTGDTGLIRSLIIYYLVANEGLSIVENLSEIGIIVPDFLKERLEQLKSKGSDSDG